MNAKIQTDGYELFGYFFMMMCSRVSWLSIAGPAPNYDMQRILSTRNPREASMMSGVVNVVLNFPRYIMITGLTILALVFYSDKIRAMGSAMDFEMVLPDASEPLRTRRAARHPAGRTAGGIHVELRGDGQRGSAVHRERHLQALHQSECERADLRAA